MADDFTRDAPILGRSVNAFAAITAILAITLWAVRTYHTISFSQPSQLMTSGDEVASIFAIWKVRHGLEVYADRFQPPYSLAVYNWLFYSSNALWSGFWLKALVLEEAWIPTLSRIWSLIGCIVGGIGAFLVFRNILRRNGLRGDGFAASLAILLVFGPLFGFWVITVRPDVWSISLEIIAIAVFMALYRKNWMASIVAAAMLAYLAWSFKHTTVFGLGGIALFLLLRKDIRALILLSVLSIILWALPLILLGNVYVETLFAIGHPLEYSTDRIVRNIINFATKTPYLWLPLIWVCVIIISQKKVTYLLHDDSSALAISGVAVSLPTALLLMAQTGSSENYLFTTAFFMTLLLVSLLPFISEFLASRRVQVSSTLIAGFLLTSVAISTVLTGQTGLLKPRGDQALINRQKACLDLLPRPLYVTSRLFALPWMTPGNEPYVRSFYYERERALGRTFANDGFGGMIDAGTFESIAHRSREVPESIDGSRMLLYQVLPVNCAEMTIFIRSGNDKIQAIEAAIRNLP